MENLESYQNNSEYVEASNNWNTKGHLGVTAKDHEIIQSTPDQILVENSGKTLGELMSDEEIREYIIETRKNILGNEAFPNMKEYNEELKENLKVTLEYLSGIGRLPEEI
jgi:hypothetical protein